MSAYRLVTSLQFATGIPAAAIVLSFLVAPHWTRSVFGPEFLLVLVLAFFVLTVAALAITYSPQDDETPAQVSKQRIRVIFVTNGATLIAAGLNGWLFRDWPIAVVVVVLGLGIPLLLLSTRYR